MSVIRTVAWLLWSVGVTTAAAVTLTGQEPPFSTSTTGVTIDVVVRDKNGAFVSGLTKDDFTLLEDDTPQTIASFIAASSNPDVIATTNSSSTTAKATPVEDVPPSYVAMVFGQLLPESRALAQKAAEAYLETRSPKDFTGVFNIDQALRITQDFTFDGPSLKAAVQAALARSARKNNDEPFTALMRTGFSLEPGKAGLFDAVDMPEVKLDEEYDSQRILIQLAQLARAMGRQPGRKSVIFLTERFSIYPGTDAYFQALIEAANRANVSFYPMDSAGLRTLSSEKIFADHMRASIDANGISTMSVDELAMNAARLQSGNVPAILTVVAHETGGFPIIGTNDLTRGIRVINQDRRQYYALAYSPTNGAFHGEYRRITVRVNRPGVVVRARAGYFALNDAVAEPAAPFEYGAFAALRQTPPPRDIPLRLGAFVFPLHDGSSEIPLRIQAPASSVTFAKAEAGYRTEVTILALIRNRDGVIVQKGSRSVRLTPAANQVDQAKAIDLQFYRQPRLAPGDYTIEAGIADALGKRAGVTKASLSVPKADDGPRVSSVVIVEGTVELPEGKTTTAVTDPIVIGRQLLVPNVGAPMSKREHPKLTYVFTVLSAQKSGVQARLELVQAGQTVGSTGLTLPAADASGTIRYAGQLPAAQLAPGSYEARIIVTEGARQAVRVTPFTITE